METSLNVIDYPEPKEQKCYVFECECVCNGKYYVYADSKEEALSRLDVGDYDDKEYDDIKIENIVEVSNE